MTPDISRVIHRLLAGDIPGEPHCSSVKQAAQRAVNIPPRSYDLTLEHALRRCRAVRRGSLPPSTPSAALAHELHSRLQHRKALTGENDTDAMTHILINEAPSRYFVTPRYAEKHYYTVMRQRRSRHRTPHSSPPLPTPNTTPPTP